MRHEFRHKKKVFYFGLALIVFLIALIVFIGNKRGGQTIGNNAPVSVGRRVVNITAGQFSFIPETITVAKGETVKIVLTSESGVHDFIVDELNVKSERVFDKQSTSIEFIAEKQGTFPFYCSVGSHKKFGQKGILTVE